MSHTKDRNEMGQIFLKEKHLRLFWFFFFLIIKVSCLLYSPQSSLSYWTEVLEKPPRTWRDSPVVRNICCSCKEPRFPVPRRLLPAVCNSGSREQTPSSGLSGKKPRTHTMPNFTALSTQGCLVLHRWLMQTDGLHFCLN